MIEHVKEYGKERADRHERRRGQLCCGLADAAAGVSTTPARSRFSWISPMKFWTLRRTLRSRSSVNLSAPMRPESPVPHILNLSVQGVKGTVFQRALSEQGICVSVKSACSTDGAPSRAVLAVSGDRRNALASWRISPSHLTTRNEIESFLQIFDLCYRELVP